MGRPRAWRTAVNDGGGGGETAPLAAATAAAVPTRHLCLRNMLSDDVLADDAEFECADDIRAEVATFGEVSKFAFPRPSDLQGYTEADVGSARALRWWATPSSAGGARWPRV